MYLRAIFLGITILACTVNLINGSDKCYYAKTCIHDGKEKCGKNGEGDVRRFIDSCDIKEYNCLKDTDYEKTSLKDCKSLPEIEEQDQASDDSEKADTKEITAESDETVTAAKKAVTGAGDTSSESANVD